MALMQAETVFDRLRNCPDLPTPPAVALRIIELAQDPFADLARTADEIALDPALSARILRIANFPLYASICRRQVTSLPQAVTLLGLNAALSLALGFSLASTLRGPDGIAEERQRIWRRSVLAALASRMLGEEAGIRELEELMLGALLQDIGALALLQVFPEAYAGLLASPAGPGEELRREREVFGADHTQVGGWLASQWKLPDSVGAMIRDSESCAAGNPMSACVAASGHMADLWLDPADERSREHALEQLLACRDLSLPAITEMIDAMTAALPEVETLFDVRLECAHQADAIKRQARELLILRNLVEIRNAAQAREAAREAETRAAELADQARRDPLTGAYNRVRLEEVLQREFDDSMRTGRPLSVAFIDLDDFKLINDRHGHLVGDEVLRRFSSTLERLLRKSDLLARYGGEEFLIVLGNCDAATAARTLQRILEEVSRAPLLEADGEPVRVTFSAGIACHGDGARFASARDLLRTADDALYGAKREGRNRISPQQPD